MVLSWNILLTIIHRGTVFPNPQMRTSCTSSKISYSLSCETSTLPWWMLNGLTKSHLSLLWILPLTSSCMERNASSHRISNFILSSWPKNPRESCLLVQRRMDTLHKLQEEGLEAKGKFWLHHNHIKRWFERKSAGKTNFSVGDLVLKWDKAHEDKSKHAKFQSLRIGPYMVHEKHSQYMYVNKCCSLLHFGFWKCVWLKFKEPCDTATLGQSCVRLHCIGCKFWLMNFSWKIRSVCKAIFGLFMNLCPA